MEEIDLGKTVRGFRAGQKVFRRYSLVRILGRGGMGVVWLARDEELERDVALKFLPDLVVNDLAVLDELKRETRRSLQLTHHHIVRIHDFVQDAESACISMEYVDGPTLSALRIEQPNKVFETHQLTPWVDQVCEVLQYAHHYAMIVHRDIKPANLMLTSRGDLKVADFGIARSLSDSMTMLTMARGTSGTLAYMSPQQLDGERASNLDDIYSLGATLYELLTSKPPFHSGSIERLIREKAPPSLAEKREQLGITSNHPIPEPWERTIAACLAKDPALRPQSGLELRDRLHGTVPPPPPVPRVETVVPHSAPPVVRRETPKFYLTNQFLLLGGAIVFVLIALALWVTKLIQNPEPVVAAPIAATSPQIVAISPTPRLPSRSPVSPSPIAPSPTPEPSATATAEPSPSPTIATRNEREEIEAMVTTQIEAGMRGDVSESIAIYADSVDFLDEGWKSREEIAKDLPDYYAHWPTRRSQLVGGISIQTLSYNERKVGYVLDFAASNSATGESRQSVVDVTWIVRRDGPSSPFKIVSHKQRRVSQETPAPTVAEVTTSDPAVEIVKSYIAALNTHDAAAAYRHFSAAYRSRVRFTEYSRRVQKTGTLIVDDIRRTVTSGTSATIELTFREQEPARLIHWHGTIGVVLDAGQWRIDSLSGLKSDR
jgi:serine/threonine protein kinase